MSRHDELRVTRPGAQTETGVQNLRMVNQALPVQIGLGHLALSVTDLDRAVSFYCNIRGDILGDILVRSPYSGDRPLPG